MTDRVLPKGPVHLPTRAGRTFDIGDLLVMIGVSIVVPIVVMVPIPLMAMPDLAVIAIPVALIVLLAVMTGFHPACTGVGRTGVISVVPLP